MSPPRTLASSSVRRSKSRKERVRITRIDPGDRKDAEPLVDHSERSSSPLPWPIEMVPTGHLRRARRNARTHPKRQIDHIVRNMRKFGYIDPVLVDDDLNIIGGHARAEAVGYDKIPAIILSGLSDAEKRALALADNKIAELGGWLRADLAVELHEIAPLLEEAGLSIELTGFEPAELDAPMGDLIDPEQDPAEAAPLVPNGEAVTIRGDTWQVGSHRILCGDATDPEDVRGLMRRELAAMVFTDPRSEILD